MNGTGDSQPIIAARKRSAVPTRIEPMMLELILWLGGIALVPLVGGAIWDWARPDYQRGANAHPSLTRRSPIGGRPSTASFIASPNPFPVASLLATAEIMVDMSHGTPHLQ